MSQSSVGGVIGGVRTVVSMKFSRTPLLHGRLDFLQFKQSGKPSSHFKWRSLHVKQPVRTRFGLAAAAAAIAAVSVDVVASLEAMTPFPITPYVPCQLVLDRFLGTEGCNQPSSACRVPHRSIPLASLVAF